MTDPVLLEAAVRRAGEAFADILRARHPGTHWTVRLRGPVRRSPPLRDDRD